jgi:4-amino-4-deoxy-L-arabinose transferase-like glycosyltransferase
MTPWTARPVARGLRTLLILLLLFLAAWLPRTLALDTFVTADEPGLLFRSANFYQAVANRDFASTVQLEHPGVPVTWAGALAFWQRLPGYATQNPGQLTVGQLEPWLQANTAVTPLELLTAGRRWIALWVALLTAASYFPLRKLWGAPLAALAVLMLAWDPFLLALTRLLHMDGLLAYLCVVALLALLAWLHGGRSWRYLILSGVMTGLALLSKSTTLILLPTVGLLLLIEGVRQFRQGERKLWTLVLAYGAWIGLAAAVIVALWPALWVIPAKALDTVLGGLRVHSAGHDSLNFFLGRKTDNPGPLFYPVAYLFRATPGALIGLIAAAVLTCRQRWPFDTAARRRSALGLTLFAALFAAEMTLGAKMFDRYITPVFLALDVVAALGLAGAVRFAVVGLKRIWRPRFGVEASTGSSGQRARPAKAASPKDDLNIHGSYQGLLFGVALAAVLLLHGLFAFSHHPYYFTYYNPLVGGSRTAPDVLFIGWGEGLDAAAGWLKQQPEARRVISWYSDGPLSYYLRPDQKALSFYFTSYLLDADYAVLYANQWQRGLPTSELVNHFLAQKPAHIVRSDGLELARIYDVRNQPPPAFVHIDTTAAADFGDRMRLAAYRLDKQILAPGDHAALTLYLKRLAETPVGYNVLLRLVAPDGAEVWRDEGWPAGEPTTGWPVDEMRFDDHRIGISGDAAPGRYTLLLSLYDPKTAALLPLADGRVAHEVVSLAVQAPGADDPTNVPSAPADQDQTGEAAPTPRMREFDVSASWGDVQMTGLQHAPQLNPGQPLRVELAAAGRVDGSRKISARLVDASGAVQAQIDERLWPHLRLHLELDGDAEPGPYTLAVVIYDPETLGPFPDAAGQFVTTLSEVEVVK